MQVDVSRILETLQGRDLIPEKCRAALLVGSAARNWSNRKSDFDIYLVSTEAQSGAELVDVSVPLYPPVVGWHTFFADNRGWDLAYWVDDQVDQMLDKVSWNQFDRVRSESGDVLTLREEGFLERLATCVPLIGEDWLMRRRATLDASAFKSVLVTRSLGAADRAIEDTLGQLEEGDLNSATLSARMALRHTVDALLEEQGQYESNNIKWRARRFQLANPSKLSFADYWELETMHNFDSGDPAKWINEVLTLCQDLALKIEA